jgi:hypothetical protein
MMEDVGTSANQLVQLDSNAKVPAVDGSLLTGMSTSLSGASDPTLSTNPSGVGIKYKNTTDGEMFICTDATAGANVWTNVGVGTGDVQPYRHGGELKGFTMCGLSSGDGVTNIIDSFSFASNGNAVDHGDMAQLSGHQFFGAGTTSGTYGYKAGASPAVNNISKFAIASTGNSTDVGNLTEAKAECSGISSADYGYAAGSNTATQDVIERWAYASDGNSADVGDTVSGIYYRYGASTSGYGYLAGGTPDSGKTTAIEKFATASSANGVAISGTLTVARADGIEPGWASSTHGYAAGGDPSSSNIIDKYSFATEANATDVGNLTAGGYGMGGQCSLTYGYSSGGYRAGYSNIIDKCAFASDGDSTDVGDLTVGRRLTMGTHG